MADPVTGEIVRTGYVKPEFLEQCNRPGCEVVPGRQGNMVEEKMIFPKNAAPYLRKRAKGEIDARRQARQIVDRSPQQAQPVDAKKLAAFLKSKGYDVTEDELKTGDVVAVKTK